MGKTLKRMFVWAVAMLFLQGGMALADVVVNELMADNGGCTNTVDNQALDWIELHNTGNTAVDISGWRIIDDSTKKWSKWQELPDGSTIQPNGYLLIWCDNDTGYTGWTNGEIHVDIGLSSTKSEGAWLADAENSIVSGFAYPSNQYANVSYGRDPADASKLVYFAVPTPGAANDANGVEEYTPPAGGDDGDQGAGAGVVDAEAEALAKSILDAGLMLLTIETVDREEPTADIVEPPAGCIGLSVANATKVPGRLTLRTSDGILYDSGAYEKKKSGMTVKIRGNVSATKFKKPYKIKLQKAADLLLRGEDETYADKDWVLLAGESDILDALGFAVNEALGMQWTPRYKFVNVIMNGKYRGHYLLVEAVERNENCRLDVDEDEGFIFEYDAYWWNEDVYFKTAGCHSIFAYTFKYPDSDDISDDQIAAISNVVENVYSAMSAGSYEQFIDVDSWSKWLLGHDFLGTHDGAGANTYFTKYNLDPASKIKMGLMWDFDTICSDIRSNNWCSAHYQGFSLFPPLLNSSNTLFRAAYCNAWKNNRARLEAAVDAVFADFLENAEALDKSRKLNAERWYIVSPDIASDVERYKAWFERHVAWLDSAIAAITPRYTITFDPNGGVGGGSEILEYEDVVTAPANPVRTGWTFLGWDKEIPATMPASNLTFAAMWKINTHKLTFDLAGGTGSADAIELVYGSEYGELPVPTRTGYSFAGWKNAAGGIVTSKTVMGDADVALVATWNVNTYSLTFDSAGGSVVLPITQAYGTDVTAPEDPTRDGWTFLGWDKEIPATMPASNLTFAAMWKINTHKLTFDLAGGTGSADAIELVYGSEYGELPVPTRTGYSFAGWKNAAGVIVTSETVMGDADVALVATWNVNTYSLTFDSAGGSAVLPITQAYGTDVTAPEDPTRGTWIFLGWDKEIPATMPASNMAFTAMWERAKTLVSIDYGLGDGIDDSIELIEYDEYGTILETLAEAAEDAASRHGLRVVGWKNADGAEVTHETRVSPSDSITAQWESFNPLYEADASSASASTAQVYDAYMLDGVGNSCGVVRVKVGKPNKKTGLAAVSATVQTLGGGKLTYRAADNGKVLIDAASVTTVTNLCHKSQTPLVLEIAGNALAGSYGEFDVFGVRNLAKTSPDVYAPWAGQNYGVVLEASDASGAGAAFAKGYSALSLAIANKGKVKVRGTMSDGTKVNSTAQLLVNEDGTEACANVFVPLYTGKTGGFAFVVWFDISGNVEVESLSDWIATKSSTPFTANLDFVDAGGLTLSGKSSLSFSLAESLPAAIDGAVVLDYSADGMDIGVESGRFVLPKAGRVALAKGTSEIDASKLGENPAALKLTYTAKSGVLKGTCNVYTQSGRRINTLKAKLYGYMVDGIGYGTVFIKKYGSLGFVLE